MAKPRPRLRAALAKTARNCPRCGMPIRIGDTIREYEQANGRIAWSHNDCRGREKWDKPLP